MDKEMEKVKAALEDFSKRVVEVVKKGKGEADKVTRVAQVRIEIGSLNRQQKDLYQELGELFYRNLDKPSKKGEAEIAETVTHIGEVEKNIASLKRALKAVREDKLAPGKRGRPPKAATGDQAAPKKRGRPPKAAKAVNAAPKRRGRPPKAASANAPSAAPKRRGRPPKSATKSQE